jgi:hypothetical protein
MSGSLDGPLWMLLALFALWLATSAMVAVASVRLASRVTAAPVRLEPEAWMALATSGSAVGGFVGVGLAAPGLTVAGASGAIALSIAVAAVGMVLGAALACGVAAFYLWMREG